MAESQARQWILDFWADKMRSSDVPDLSGLGPDLEDSVLFEWKLESDKLARDLLYTRPRL